jgi:hypothetical protein
MSGAIPHPHSPNTSSWRGAQLKKAQGQLYLYLTNCLHGEESSRIDNHSATQEITRLLLNLNVHYHVHKSLPLVHVLSQMNPVLTFPPYFFKVQPTLKSVSKKKFQCLMRSLCYVINL